MTRRRTARLRRTVLAALVAAAVAVPVSAAALPEAPAPAPARFAAATGAPERYAASHANLREAARMADEAGRDTRAAGLRRMAAGGAQFLAFDGRGSGRAVEVLGDLGDADRIAVVVPGSDTTLDTYQRFRSGAVALQERMRAAHPRSAVVAWLGYDTPGTVSPSVLTSGRADEAADALGPFLRGLHGMNSRAGISLLCHSYGSVVCARTETGPAVTDVALFGSPGTGAGSAAELPGTARIWAGRGADDWIAGVPHTRLELPGLAIGFGTDPVDSAFGARVFDAGAGGHSDYLKPGSTSLDSLARIAAGQTPQPEASRA
ncbi:alpha/beta hydrolase [Streptomyces sp. NBC_00239]|uniref:alpha/beta hydrolase n=1 Tax=Streptomyces sp. NBC_00239 TaxID=2903640 RepID=UPI002E295A5F|nr:alpha/beta hydrolase [Streptomyces sp. NBC_00239]